MDLSLPALDIAWQRRAKVFAETVLFPQELDLELNGSLSPATKRSLREAVTAHAFLQAGDVRAQVLQGDALWHLRILQGDRLRRRGVAAHIARDRTIFDGQRRLAIGAIQRELKARLASVEENLPRLTSDHHVGQRR